MALNYNKLLDKRFIMMVYFVSLAIIVTITEPSGSVSSQYHHIGNPRQIDIMMQLMFWMAAIISMWWKSWRFVALIPLLVYFGFSVLWFIDTGNAASVFFIGTSILGISHVMYGLEVKKLWIKRN